LKKKLGKKKPLFLKDKKKKLFLKKSKNYKKKKEKNENLMGWPKLKNYIQQNNKK